MKRRRLLPWILFLLVVGGGVYLVDHYFIGPYRTDCYINFERGQDRSSATVQHVLSAFLYDVDVLDRPGADPGHTPSLLVTAGAGDDEERELEQLIRAVLRRVPEGRLESNDCRQRPFFQ
jgi:hypothetical protein